MLLLLHFFSLAVTLLVMAADGGQIFGCVDRLGTASPRGLGNIQDCLSLLFMVPLHRLRTEALLSLGKVAGPII